MSEGVTMEVPPPETIGDLVRAAIKVHDMKRPRSIQTQSGTLGPSDLGFCRNKATLVMKGVPASDSKSIWPAVIGTALGEYVEQSLDEAFPNWQVGSVTGQRVTHVFPSGALVGGTPDIVIPAWNMVLDLKTKDGYSWVKREPWSQNYLFQLTTYALGLVDAGILDGSRPVIIGLVFIDRSGGDEDPYVVTRLLDPGLEDEIDSWITDVGYAVRNDEDAMRDIPAPVCEQICEFFTVCRGGLPMEEAEFITDHVLVGAIDMYLEARAAKSEAEAAMEEAKQMLKGCDGTTGEWVVRHTDVPESEVPGYARRAYTKMEIVRQR
jgi:hypothetical protein